MTPAKRVVGASDTAGLSAVQSVAVAPTDVPLSTSLSLLELRALLRGAPAAIIGVDEQMRIVLFTMRAQSMFGYESREIVGKPLATVLTDFRAVTRHAPDSAPLSSDERPFVGVRQARGCRQTGDPFPVETTISRVHVVNRVFTMLTVRDVKARQHAETAREDFYRRERATRELAGALIHRLRDAAQPFPASSSGLVRRQTKEDEKDRDVAPRSDDTMANVAHDLRNPLATIATLLRRLANEPDADRRMELVELADDCVDWMQRMVSDLVDMGSIEAGRLRIDAARTDVVRLLVEAEALFRPVLEGRGLAFVLDVPDALPRMSLDRDRILQVLGNLLSNAAKATPRGGRVELTARQVDATIEVSVRDNGRGIRPAHQPRVFERFWGEAVGDEPRGTGLGLAIAKGVVDAHGGVIRFTSAEGEGSTFTFSLPVLRTAEPAVAHDRPSPPGA